MNVKEALDTWTTMFETRKIESPRLSAELLLAHVLNQSRTDLLTHPERQLAQREESELDSVMQRRLKHEPVPYITGKVEFYSLPFSIASGVFIPRPETETVVDVTLEAVSSLNVVPKIFEMGIGCGAITIALAMNLDDGEFLGTDVSNLAIQVASHNVRTHALQNYVVLREGTLFTPLRTELSKDFDIFVCNPPYIKSNDIPKLPNQIKDFEPHIALDGGRDGMVFIKTVLDGVTLILKPGGFVILEADPSIVPVLRTEVRRRHHFEDFKSFQDASGKERVVTFRTRGAHH